jgi:hypothetical protein
LEGPGKLSPREQPSSEPQDLMVYSGFCAKSLARRHAGVQGGEDGEHIFIPLQNESIILTCRQRVNEREERVEKPLHFHHAILCLRGSLNCTAGSIPDDADVTIY